MESVEAALRPLTLPTLPHDLAQLSDLKLQLATARQAIHGYARLEGKLESFTDEPVWDAFIPFGPLAYFPGQLVHTNDITVPENEAAPPKGEGSSRNKPELTQTSRLRSAKQARQQAEQLRNDLEAHVAALEKEIATKEEELRQKRLNERKKGKGKAADLVGGDMGEEDWTINERGEVINEEGLPMFDIREDLPPEPVASTSSAGADTATAEPNEAPKRRFLIKKGGKQTIGMLKSAPSPSISSSPSHSAPSPPAPPLTAPASASPARVSGDNPIPDRPRLDIKAILDELEAEERSTAAVADADPESTATDEAAKEEPTRVEAASPSTRNADTAPIDPKKPASAGFAGFAPGFLSKSKQKRPSNSLQSATTAAAVPSSPPKAGPVQAVAPILADGQPLKPALSRPVSPSRANGISTPQEKKRVAFDLPPPTSSEGEPVKPKKAPIILGMGDKTPEFDETISSDEFKAGTPAAASDLAKAKEEAKTPPVRPIRDTVVEKPLRKPVPPGGALGGGTAIATPAKRVSRFKRMKEEALDEGADKQAEKPATPRPEWNGPPEVLSTSSQTEQAGVNAIAGSHSSMPSSATTTSASAVPAPVHTISFKAPAADAPTPEGTMSYADIPYDSNEEDEDDQEEPYGGDSDEDDFGYSDEDEMDEEELDVDAALHAREVALAYHQQRLNLGGGRGTGALGGYHEVGQSPFGHIGRDAEGIVPADATLQSLDPEIAANAFGSYANAGSAQLGKGSRFRNATRNLESAQLIIPSLLAADPTFTTSKEALGPASGSSDPAAAVDDDGLDESERERLRKTLEAIAEGRPLPEDQQQYERQREIFLREELAQEKEERERERRTRERTAGKQPPMLEQRIPTGHRPEAASKSSPATGAAPIASTVVEKAPAASSASAAPPVAPDAAAPSTEAEPPKRMSRFRQKQLGLID